MIWFFISFLVSSEHNWTIYGALVISIAYLSVYVYQYQQQYISIHQGFLKINHPFASVISLSQIQAIKKIAGDYILQTPTKKITIRTKIIEETSLKELHLVLDKLSVS
ncbi:hypothetical protein [Ochrovirga pacifica]|uniref:hypothetical protein n=1 Tax=Ochrovirga pacifica TaxID=1042376 RepID=UPI000680A1D2|nr:hypothetical protein [Ochrovirga pacifica]